MNRVSFQGERGAYSEAASISFFEGEIETIPCSTFADVLKIRKIAQVITPFCLLKIHLKEVWAKAMTCYYLRILLLQVKFIIGYIIAL